MGCRITIRAALIITGKVRSRFVTFFQPISQLSGMAAPSPMMQFNRVAVRNVVEDDRVQISLIYPPNAQKPRTFNFDRLKTEDLDKTLTRISNNITKVAQKKVNKKSLPADSVPDNQEVKVILISSDGTPVPKELANEKAWIPGSVLCIADINYEVCLNVPAVKSLSLPDNMLVGFVQFPFVEMEFTTKDSCIFKWYRSSSPVILADESKDSMSRSSDDACNNVIAAKEKTMKSEWVHVHTGMTYLPTEQDSQCQLKLECIPVDGDVVGETTSAVSKGPVTCGPDKYPFEKRHTYTSSKTGSNSFRVVSYNILADLYADSDFSRDFLYPYCPSHALSFSYRKQLLIKELTGYNADIVCLQEVDKKFFELELVEMMQLDGLTGQLRLKNGEVNEGSATFYRTTKFRPVAEHDVVLTDALQNKKSSQDLLDKIKTSPSLEEKMMQRSTTLQVTVLQSIDHPDRYILVATTHLYFHPRASHVRLIQMALCLRHIEELLAEYKKQGIRPMILFCGDLNSSPEVGVHEFLNQGSLAARHADWYAGGKEEFLPGMNLSHKLKLSSACGFPRYTNYVSTFSGCLDYIYIEPELTKVIQVVPMPTHEEVVEYTALPNVVFPSDHLAVICDLTWK